MKERDFYRLFTVKVFFIDNADALLFVGVRWPISTKAYLVWKVEIMEEK